MLICSSGSHSINKRLEMHEMSIRMNDMLGISFHLLFQSINAMSIFFFFLVRTIHCIEYREQLNFGTIRDRVGWFFFSIMVAGGTRRYFHLCN